MSYSIDRDSMLFIAIFIAIPVFVGMISAPVWGVLAFIIISILVRMIFITLVKRETQS